MDSRVDGGDAADAAAAAVVAVVGLGYVGLPLAVAFGAVCRTIGFDPSEPKIAAYRRGVDPAGEVPHAAFAAAPLLQLTGDAALLAQADFVIVAVPTPVDDANIPDLSALVDASTRVARALRPGTTVVFESTVYPGATEEVCVPVLEQVSGLRWKTDFFVGYSPERINPGDRAHSLPHVVKVVAGDTPATLARVEATYRRVVPAGTYRASSIRVAEAAKVIENTQRDLNIALVNELSMLFHQIGLDTAEVLAAAGTKWNFLPFRPGLVGGHCIGVDPYYLTHMAQRVGFHPQVILAGRRINDGMPKYIAEQTVKSLIQSGVSIKGSHVNVLGLSFKEDCADLRNSKVVPMIHELESYGVGVHVHDPLADPAQAWKEHRIELTEWQHLPRANAIVAAVGHAPLCARSLDEIAGKLCRGGLYVDVKSRADAGALAERGFQVWRL